MIVTTSSHDTMDCKERPKRICVGLVAHFMGKSTELSCRATNDPVNYRFQSDDVDSVQHELLRREQIDLTFSLIDNCATNAEDSKRTAAPAARSSSFGSTISSTFHAESPGESRRLPTVCASISETRRNAHFHIVMSRSILSFNLVVHCSRVSLLVTINEFENNSFC